MILFKWMVLGVLALPIWAEDVSLVDGTVLKEVVVTSKGQDYVQVRHAGGACRVLYHNLPPEWQERYQMTPAQVEARRAEAKQQAEVRQKAKAEADARRREWLEAAGQQPRYLTGAEVLRLLSPLDTVGSREAEYLAVEWNRREALRLGLGTESARFAEDARVLRGAFEADRQAFLSQYKDGVKAREKVSALNAKLAEAEKQVKLLKEENAALRQEPLYRAPVTTVVVPARQPVLMVRPVKPPPPGFRPGGRPGMPGGRPLPPPGKPGGGNQSNFRS